MTLVAIISLVSRWSGPTIGGLLMGLPWMTGPLLIFLALVRRVFAAGLEQPDLYSKLLATGMGATLGFQVVIIVGGVIGLFPLTGITLPFVSYGGSSLIASWIAGGLILNVSQHATSAEA